MGILRKAVGATRFASGDTTLFGRSRQAAEGITPEELQPLLRTLLAESTLETTPARKVLSKLKSIASRCGPFLTASEIQRCLANFDFKNEDGLPLQKARAYELAAKLHWEYIHKEIKQMDSKSRRLGSTVYAVFVEEMIECLLRGEDPLKAIEIPAVLADELLRKAFTPSPYTGTYFVLAERTVAAAHDGYKYWIDERRRLLSLNHKDSKREVDQQFFEDAQRVVNYLKAIEKSLHGLSEELGEIKYEPAESEAGDELRAAFLNSLQSVAKQAGYPPFMAMVLEHRALDAATAEPEAEKALNTEAASHYESQAKIEDEMHLPILSERRMKEAHRLQEV